MKTKKQIQDKIKESKEYIEEYKQMREIVNMNDWDNELPLIYEYIEALEWVLND